MLSFNQYLSEWTKRVAPSDPKELDKYLSGEPSRKKEDSNYEDVFAHGIKSLRNDIHGKDVVRKHLERFASHPNRYARAAVAESPHIHEHPDLVEKLKNDSSSKVVNAINSPRKKTVLDKAPVQKAEAPKKEKVKAVPKAKAEKPAKEKAAKKENGPGKYTAEKPNVDDTAFSGAKDVTHILHNGKVVGAAVSSEHGSDYGSVKRHTSYVGSPQKGFKPLENHGSHLDAVKHIVKNHSGN